MKLEERLCACGCRKTFRCLPTSATRYSSLHCMELAGALPPPEKFGRGGKPVRPGSAPVGAKNAASAPSSFEDAEDSPDDSDDNEDLPGLEDDTPLLLDEEDESLESIKSRRPKDSSGGTVIEIDPAV